MCECKELQEAARLVKDTGKIDHMIVDNDPQSIGTVRRLRAVIQSDQSLKNNRSYIEWAIRHGDCCLFGKSHPTSQEYARLKETGEIDLCPYCNQSMKGDPTK